MVTSEPFPPPSQLLGTNTHLQKEQRRSVLATTFLLTETFIENWEGRLQ